MKIAIIGAGYVGLPSSACFANIGHTVYCIDIDKDKVAKINDGKSVIYEKGLQDILDNNINKNLIVSTDFKKYIPKVDIVILAVGTPTDKITKRTNLSYIFGAAKSIAPYLSGYTVIATKSTVPVGTGFRIKNLIINANKDAQIDIASIPEFLREGDTIYDFMHPDRIIIGTQTAKSKKIINDLYAYFIDKKIPVVNCDVKSAELIKYTANSFLGIKISFINEISDMCEKLGTNIHMIKKGIGLDPRIGTSFLNPGPGFGGSCFPKDMIEMSAMAKEIDYNVSLIDTATSCNNKRFNQMVKKITTILNNHKIKEATVAFLGLTFKANTDDIRFSPAIKILNKLSSHVKIIQAYDPKANTKTYEFPNNVKTCQSLTQAITGADIVVIATEWQEFQYIDFKANKNLVKNPIVFDMRNIINAKNCVDNHWYYYQIGINH